MILELTLFVKILLNPPACNTQLEHLLKLEVLLPIKLCSCSQNYLGPDLVTYSVILSVCLCCTAANMAGIIWMMQEHTHLA